MASQNKFVIEIKPTEKQAIGWQYLRDNKTQFILFGGGCFTGKTLIKTISGYKQIRNIKQGDKVLSYNTDTKSFSYERVIERFIYKPHHHNLIKINYNGEDIYVTENHEFLYNGEWIAIKELLRRRVETTQRLKPKILDKQLWKVKKLYDEIRKDNETCNKSERLSSYNDCNKWQKSTDKITSISRRIFCTKSRRQTTDKPQRLQQKEQSCIQSGMGNKQGEFSSCQRKRFNEWIYGAIRKIREFTTFTGRRDSNKQTNRKGSARDKTEIQTQKIHERNVRQGIQCQTSNNKRYSSKKKLEAREIDINKINDWEYVEQNEPVYDLNVENNHNYVITKNNIIVHNSGGAKSWLGCEWLLLNCLAYPKSKWFMGRNELKRLKGSTYQTFLKVCAWHKIPDTCWKLNSQESYIMFWNGSRIDLIDVAYQPSDPLYERFGSMEFTGGWLEEVGEIRGEAFDILKSRIGRHLNDEFNLHPKIFLTCNPKKNWVYFDFYKPWREGTLSDDTCFIQSLYNDNPYTSRTYGETLSKLKSKATRDRLMYGLWEYEDDDAILMEYEKILAIFDRELNVTPDSEMYLSVDIARYGRDRTVFILWHGYHIKKIWYYDKSSTQFIEEKIQSVARQYKIPYRNIVVDQDGVGGGVVDHIPGVYAFVNAGRPIQEWDDDKRWREQDTDRFAYKNLRAQCYDRLGDYINDGIIGCYRDIDPQIRNMLVEELESIRRKDVEDNEKKFQVISKEEIKKDILGRSPDFSDAMMMRMVFGLGDIRETVVDSGDGFEIEIAW